MSIKSRQIKEAAATQAIIDKKEAARKEYRTEAMKAIRFARDSQEVNAEVSNAVSIEDYSVTSARMMDEVNGSGRTITSIEIMENVRFK